MIHLKVRLLLARSQAESFIIGDVPLSL